MSILIFLGILFIYWLLDPTVIYMCNAFGIMATSDSDTAFMISTLLQSCWSIGAFVFAFWVCSKWKKRKATKQVTESPTAEEPPVPESEPAPTTPKHRFCKLCGSPIDHATRKCTGCGKQYFRPPVLLKKHLAIVAGILACVAVVFLIFTLNAQRNAAEAKVEELNVQIAELNTKLAEQKDISHNKAMTNSALRSAFDELQKRYDKLSEEHAIYRDSLRYCESYCGFIIPTGSSVYNGVKIYHRLDCPYAESIENLVMIEIGYLEEKGYKPCPHCYG